MFFNVALFISLAFFLAGVIYKMFGWVHRQVGPVSPNVGTGERITAALGGLGRTLFSLKVLLLIKSLFTEVLLQLHFLRKKKNPYVWCMHICLFWGTILLLCMHALQVFISGHVAANNLPH